jgi:hypothetical protein
MYLVILGIYVVQNNIQSNLSYVVCPREQWKIVREETGADYRSTWDKFFDK